MKVVVVGGSGNVGSAVLRWGLQGGGKHGLIAVSRRRTAMAGVIWHALDVGEAGAVDHLARVFEDADAVVHLAWLIQPGRDEAVIRRTNVDGTRHVTEAVLRARVGHLVVASSVGAYRAGPKDIAVDESWPTDGIPSSAYSRHKSEVERYLDGIERQHPDLVVSPLRPGLIFQGAAASEIARYFLGALVPTSVLGRLKIPVLPLPHRLRFQAVHADDVAAAYWTVLETRAAGAFNVAGEPGLTPDDLARAVGAGRAIGLPLAVLRTVVALTWRAHLQPTDPGWIDLASGVPMMSTQRLRNLGWTPSVDARAALAELAEGLHSGRGEPHLPPLVGRDLDRGGV